MRDGQDPLSTDKSQLFLQAFSLAFGAFLFSPVLAPLSSCLLSREHRTGPGHQCTIWTAMSGPLLVLRRVGMTSIEPPASSCRVCALSLDGRFMMPALQGRDQSSRVPLGRGGALGPSLCCVVLSSLLLWPRSPSFAMSCGGIRAG